MTRPGVAGRLIRCLVFLAFLNLMTAWSLLGSLSDSLTPSLHSRHGNKICFVQSLFGDPKHRALDRPYNVTSLYPTHKSRNSLTYEFFYFTNINHLVTPGWTKILIPDSKMRPIQRHITMSRQAKFLAWKIEPRIGTECRMVLYMDAYYYPRPNDHAKFEGIANALIESKYGLFHILHHIGGSLTDEFERIVWCTKDTQDHVDASLAWLTAQPDWNNTATLYWNAVFAYDPANPYYRRASEFFWDRYSKELDSWRDQPLWAYTLHHFGIQPLTARPEALHSIVYEDLTLKGDHSYADEDAVSHAKSER